MLLCPVTKIINADNEEVEVANDPMEILQIPVSVELQKDDMGRKVI